MKEIEKKPHIVKKAKKMGRPPKWTEEKIGDMIYYLLDWIEKENSYALIQFCCHQCITKGQLTHLVEKSEDFARALSYAKSRIASRMIENINSKDGNCHPAFFNKYIRANDFLLDAFFKDQEKTQINEMNKRDVRIVDFSTYKKQQKEIQNEV